MQGERSTGRKFWRLLGLHCSRFRPRNLLDRLNIAARRKHIRLPPPLKIWVIKVVFGCGTTKDGTVPSLVLRMGPSHPIPLGVCLVEGHG